MRAERVCKELLWKQKCCVIIPFNYQVCAWVQKFITTADLRAVVRLQYFKVIVDISGMIVYNLRRLSVHDSL